MLRSLINIHREIEMKVINVMAISLDGRIASYATETDSDRIAAGFGHPDDQAHLLKHIAQADAVIVGARTILASGLIPEVETISGRQPHWYIATRQNLPHDAMIWQQARVPRTLVVPRGWQNELITQLGIAKFEYDLSVPWPVALLHELRVKGVKTVLLLGGAMINREFYAASLVDELIVTVLPIILGQDTAIPLVAPSLPTASHLTLLSSQAGGDLVFLRYQCQK